MRDGREVWRVTVHYFPTAALAGVHPVEATLGQIFDADERKDHPEYYRPHEFLFDRAPSREDFLACMQTMPWTSVWDSTLFPALALSEWPMVDWMHKAGSTTITDDQGRTVGRINIDRDYICLNRGIDRNLAVTCNLYDRALRYVPKDRRTEAQELIRNNEDRIKERAFHANGRTTAHSENPSDELILREIECLFHEHGLRQARPRKVVNAAS